MANFLPVFFWGLAVLAALTGWGRLLGQSQKSAGHNPAADWLEAPAWGIALSSLIGGLLNLAGLATQVGMVIFILAGCTLFAFSLIAPVKNLAQHARWRSYLTDWRWLALLALPLSALAVRFGASVMIDTFFPYSTWSAHTIINPQDDALSYLVSPERMLQTGSIGQDPFNSRQMMSALGTQHFLNALELAIFPVDNVHVIEGGVALAAACLAAAGLGVRLKLGRTGATLLMLVPLISRPWFVNVSSTNTSVVVLIALGSALIQLFKPDAPPRRWLIISGMLLGAACALKGTTIPTAGVLMVGAAGLTALAQKSWRPLALGALAGLLALAAMLPWMWWQYHSSGTLLYPILGRGFHVEVFFPSKLVPFHGDAVDALKLGLILPITLLIALLLSWTFSTVRASADETTATVTLAMVAGWAVAWPLIAVSTEYNGVGRYLIAARLAALTMALAYGWHVGQQLSERSGWRRARYTGPFLLAALLLGQPTELYLSYGQIVPHDLTNGLTGKLHYWTSLRTLYQMAQAAVPADAKILTYTDTPFLFDFTSNSIFVADWPGESSPPPGMPVNQGGEAVAAYLLAQNIRYVIYSYKSEADFPRSVYSIYLDRRLGDVLNRTAVLSFAFQDDITELAQTRVHLYDDGYLYVLDLASHQPAKPAIP